MNQKSTSIAAIIPALNEEAHIESLVLRLNMFGIDEVIVVDGGSSDSTTFLAQRAGAVVLHSYPNRGAQLSVGAQTARSEIIWLVHADSCPPTHAVSFIRQTMMRRDIAMGCFPISFDAPHPLLKVFALASRAESFLTTFGDQGFFLRRACLKEIGGYPPLPLLDDVELRCRIKKSGGKIVKSTMPIQTSARRFIRDGVLRRQLKNAALLARYFMGVAPTRLAAEYFSGAASRD